MMDLSSIFVGVPKKAYSGQLFSPQYLCGRPFQKDETPLVRISKSCINSTIHRHGMTLHLSCPNVTDFGSPASNSVPSSTCRLCLPSPQRSLASLGLMLTCMYTGMYQEYHLSCRLNEFCNKTVTFFLINSSPRIRCFSPLLDLPVLHSYFSPVFLNGFSGRMILYWSGRF